MQQIKFSHRYAKMPADVSSTILLEVLKSNTIELSKQFIIYDTAYELCKYYKLPAGNVLVLLLLSKETNAVGGLNETLWTTIRRHTPEKEKYYRSLYGQYIEIVIEGEIQVHIPTVVIDEEQKQ